MIQHKWTDDRGFEWDLQQFGPAAAWAVPAGISLIGSIIGNNSANHNAQQANQAAQQSADTQTALTQQQMALYNSMLQDYQQNYQPLEPGLAAQMQGQLGGLDQSAITSQYLNALSPGNTDSATGVPWQQTMQNNLSYLSNPGGTLSGMGGVGGQALMQMLGGAQGGSGLAGMTPQAIQGFLQNAGQAQNVGNQVISADQMKTGLQQQLPGAQHGINQSTNQYGNAVGSVMQGLQQNPLAGLGSDVMAQLGQQTNLGGMTPGVQHSLLGGGVTGSGTSPGVGADALSYYMNQARNGGIDPMLISNALGQQQTGFDRNLADVRNSLGGRTNIGSIMRDMGTQHDESQANLIAQMTGQSQQLRNQAMGNALGAGQSIDSQSAQRMLQALGAGGQLDSQTSQNLLSKFGVGQSTQQQGVSQLMDQLTASGQLNNSQMQSILSSMGLAGQADTQNLNLNQQMLGAAGQNANVGAAGWNNALGAAGGLDQQQMQYLTQAMQTAGGIDAQTMQMLQQAMGQAQNAQQYQLGNLGTAYNTGQQTLGNVQNYVGQGRNFLPGVASGINDVSKQYANAGANAAYNASQNQYLASQSNPFSSLGNALANNPAFGKPYNAPAAGPAGGGGLGQQYLGASTAYGYGNPNAM